MSRASRVACLLVGAAVVLGAPAAVCRSRRGQQRRAVQGPRLHGPGGRHRAASPAIKALRELGQRAAFRGRGDDDPGSSRSRTLRIPRGRLPEHLRRRARPTPSRPRSRSTTATAAASSASARRSRPSRLAVPDRRPRHPGRGPPGVQPARSRSPTACTPRRRTCRSTGPHRRAGTTSRPTSAASQPRAGHGRRGSTSGRAALGRPAHRHHRRHDGLRPPVTWCKDYQGGRSFYTALGTTAAAASPTPTCAPTSPARSVGGRRVRPGLQRLRRDRAGQLPADGGQRARRT